MVGLSFALLGARRGHVRIVDGVIEVHGPLLARLLASGLPRPQGIAAITLGHVVLGRNARTLEATRAHERVHVAQYERWGPFFLPAYLAASLVALARGRHPYFDNPFERDAWRREASRKV